MSSRATVLRTGISFIGAHYDGQDGFPSASDNAAGVAVLIELARDLKAMNLPVSIVAVAFDDEEQGLNGSNFYVDHPIFPLEQTEAAVIFDTMGRHFLDLKTIHSLCAGHGVLAGTGCRSWIAVRRPDMLVAGSGPDRTAQRLRGICAQEDSLSVLQPRHSQGLPRRGRPARNCSIIREIAEDANVD